MIASHVIGMMWVVEDLATVDVMRVQGKRKVRAITVKASGELLREGAMFNDELHKLPTGQSTFMPRGIYRFKTHEEAANHRAECEMKRMLSRG